LFAVELPHAEAEELFALLQSMPALGDAVYDGAMAGWDSILCCCGKLGLPIPGFAGLMAGKEELRDEKLVAGVMALPLPWGADRFVCRGGETGGVDQENVAGAGDALLDRFAGREGRMVEDDAEAEAFPHGSPPSMSEVPVPPWPPRTSASKFVSSPPLLLESRPFDAGGPPKLMNSFRVVALVLLAPSSCSFRVCSCSMRAEVDLIKFM
jgi:hypothetical protein